MDDGRIVLERLEHRGAVGEEVNTGDGAGIMTSIPHDFFVKVIKDLDFKLPSEGQYLVGNIFLNPHRAIRLQTKKRFQQIAEDLNLKILGWRKLPTDNSTLGPSALSLVRIKVNLRAANCMTTMKIYAILIIIQNLQWSTLDFRQTHFLHGREPNRCCEAIETG
eukprot:GSMAST32.ASY1.ANO1.804.1 assembled CDS